MSQSRTRIPSPARSMPLTPRRRETPRKTRSVCSPARSNASGRLSCIVQEHRERALSSFGVSPLTRKSVLTDNTDIEEPGRKSWWRDLGENSRDVMEVLKDNEAEPHDIFENIEILSQEEKRYTLDLQDSSNSESIQSIIIPQRKLFHEKENRSQEKFSNFGTRETLDKLQKPNATASDKIVSTATKELFQAKPRSKPVFPAALLDISSNTTASEKTMTAVVETKVRVHNFFNKQPNKNQTAKRKNMFAKFIASDSEEELPEIQPKFFALQKKTDSRRPSMSSRGVDTSMTSSIDIELDEWQLLPSSTMVDHQLNTTLTAGQKPKRQRLSKLLEAECDTNSSGSSKAKQLNKSISSKNKSVLQENSSKQDTSIKNINSSKISKNPDEEINKSQNKSSSSLNTSQSSIITRSKNKSDVANKSKNNSINKSKSFNVSKNAKASLKQTNDKNVVNKSFSEISVTPNQNNVTNNKEVGNELRNSADIDDGINFTLEYKGDNDDELHQVNTSKQNRSGTIKSNKDLNTSKNTSLQPRNDIGYKETSIRNDNTLDKNIQNTVIGKSAETSENNKSNTPTRNKNKENISNDNMNDNIVLDQDELTDEEAPNESQKSHNQIQQLENDKKDSKEQNNDQEENVIEQIETKNDQEISEDEQNGINNDQEETEDEQNDQEESNEEQIEIENDQEETEGEQNEIENDQQETENEQIENDQEETEDEQNEIENDQQETEDEQIENDQEETEDEQNEIENDQQETEDEQIENDQEGSDNQQNEIENDHEESDDEHNEIENDQENSKNEQIENEQDENQNVQNEIENDQEESEVDQNEIENEEEESEDQQSEIEDENTSQEEMEQNESEVDDQEMECEESNESKETYSDPDDDKENNMECDDAHESIEAAAGSGQSDNQENNSDHDDDEIENTETPNVSHDTTGRNRKRNEKKSLTPEAVLRNSKDQVDVTRVHGRNTSIRKTKSIILNMSLEKPRQSMEFSGSKNSSAEGSGWDSHRTTRKTLRQTFGKDFTPRKSLRAMVMEKSAKRKVTAVNDTVAEPQANSTELPEMSTNNYEVRDDPSEIHEVSIRTRQVTIVECLERAMKEWATENAEVKEKVRQRLEQNKTKMENPFKVPARPKFPRPVTKPKPKTKTSLPLVPLDNLPEEFIQDLKYKPPKRFAPRNAAWLTKRLYKYLETKLKPKYDYKARVRAEEFARMLYEFVQALRRRGAPAVAAPRSVDALKHEMARLNFVKTHFEFYNFFHEFMPREVRIKVIPDIVNKIPHPRNGIFSDIL